MIYPRKIISIGLAFIFIFGFIGCSGQSSQSTVEPNTVEVKMFDYTFEVPSSVPSGWNTFRMLNLGEETHEFVLHRLPEDKTFDDMYNQVIQPLDSLQQLLIDGDIDSTEHEKLVSKNLPKWTGNLEIKGGGGLITPGEESDISLNLEPGQYVISCFIPSSNGRSHVYQGMIRPVTVNGNYSSNINPDPDVTITSTGDKIDQEGTLGLGKQTIAFYVEEPSADSITPFNTMLLAQLNDPMHKVEDLRNHVANPPSIPYLGGAIAIPARDTAYVTVKFTVPGSYAWEFPHGEKEAKLKKFVIR